MAESSTKRAAKCKAKKKQAGFVYKEWCVMPEWIEKIERLLEKLRKDRK